MRHARWPIGCFHRNSDGFLLVPEAHLHFIGIHRHDAPLQYLFVQYRVTFVLPRVDDADIPLTEIHQPVARARKAHDEVAPSIIDLRDREVIQDIQCFRPFLKRAVPERGDPRGRFPLDNAYFLVVKLPRYKARESVKIAFLQLAARAKAFLYPVDLLGIEGGEPSPFVHGMEERGKERSHLLVVAVGSRFSLATIRLRVFTMAFPASRPHRREGFLLPCFCGVEDGRVHLTRGLKHAFDQQAIHGRLHLVVEATYRGCMQGREPPDFSSTMAAFVPQQPVATGRAALEIQISLKKEGSKVHWCISMPCLGKSCCTTRRIFSNCCSAFSMNSLKSRGARISLQLAYSRASA